MHTLKLRDLSVEQRSQVCQEAEYRVKFDAHSLLTSLFSACDEVGMIEEICNSHYLRVIYIYGYDCKFKPIRISLNPFTQLTESFNKQLRSARQVKNTSTGTNHSNSYTNNNINISENKLCCWLTVELQSGCIVQHVLCALEINNELEEFSNKSNSNITLVSNAIPSTRRCDEESVTSQSLDNYNKHTELQHLHQKTEHRQSQSFISSSSINPRATVLDNWKDSCVSPEVAFSMIRESQQTNINAVIAAQKQNEQIANDDVAVDKTIGNNNNQKIGDFIECTRTTNNNVYNKSLPRTSYDEQREELWRLADSEMTHTLYDRNDHVSVYYTPVSLIKYK